jgi:hypothetical protein
LEDAEGDATAAPQTFAFPDGHTPRYLLGADLYEVFAWKRSFTINAGVELGRAQFASGFWGRTRYGWVDPGTTLLGLNLWVLTHRRDHFFIFYTYSTL